MKYLKDDLKDFKPYNSKDITDGIILNSNESPFMPPKPIIDDFIAKVKNINLNRYPDMSLSKLKEVIAKTYNFSESEITCGVGSDELIDVIFRATLNKGDNAISFSPSFSMYNVFAKMEGANVIPVYNSNFTLDKNQMIESIKKYNPKIVLICSPNNPTGAYLGYDDIKEIAESTDALVVVDIAYIEFAREDLLNLARIKNIICLKTLSKAFSLPSIRLGIAFSNKENISMIEAIKPPYTVNSLTEAFAISAISNKNLYNNNIKYIIKERERVYNELKNMDLEVYPSEANFIYVKLKDIDFVSKKIYIRSFGNEYYRITIGLKEENDKVLEVIKNAYK